VKVHGGRIQQPMDLLISSGIFAEPFDEKKYEREYLSGLIAEPSPHILELTIATTSPLT